MYAAAKHVKNTLSVSFERHEGVRRLANAFEDLLRGKYHQPHLLPVPDELDPEIPRVIFGSIHGFSQIVISQVSVSLNVQYSRDWQEDNTLREPYLRERAEHIFDLVELTERKPRFSGLITVVNNPWQGKEETLIERLRRVVEWQTALDQLQDVDLKITTVQEDQYFNNVTVKNYQAWHGQDASMAGAGGVPRMPRQAATEVGMQIMCDFNDRYAYNESETYFTSRDASNLVISKGLESTAAAILALRSDLG